MRINLIASLAAQLQMMLRQACNCIPRHCLSILSLGSTTNEESRSQ